MATLNGKTLSTRLCNLNFYKAMDANHAIVFLCSVNDKMDNNKKVKFQWLRSAVCSPTKFHKSNVGEHKPSRWSMSPKEDLSPSSTVLNVSSESSDVGELGNICLDTPKRKAETQNGSNLGTDKVKKLSRKHLKSINPSKVSHVRLVHKQNFLKTWRLESFFSFCP